MIKDLVIFKEGDGFNKGIGFFFIRIVRNKKFIPKKICLGYKEDKGSQRGGTIPTKPRFRSVPDVAVLNSQIPLLAGLLIKYQRLPRGFFWNSFLLSASFLFFSVLWISIYSPKLLLTIKLA